MAPRWLEIALCWLKFGPRRPKWPLKASQVPQDETKMAPRWLPNWYVLASWSFFRDVLPDLCFPMNWCFSKAWNTSIVVHFWSKFWWILDHFWHLGSCMPQEVSRYPHDCCRIAYLSLSGPYMDPSWLQVGLNMPKMGPMSLQEAPRASKMSQDGLKMPPKSIFLRHILLFFYNFHKYWKSGSRFSQGHFFNDLHPLIL